MRRLQWFWMFFFFFSSIHPMLFFVELHVIESMWFNIFTFFVEIRCIVHVTMMLMMRRLLYGRAQYCFCFASMSRLNWIPCTRSALLSVYPVAWRASDTILWMNSILCMFYFSSVRYKMKCSSGERMNKCEALHSIEFISYNSPVWVHLLNE